MVVENLSKLPDSSIYDKIREVAPQLFDFDFEIWDENHKLELETKIISHYLNYEIGLETLGLWKFYLQQKMNEIMPYYNELAKSLNLDFDILKDVDYQEEFSGNEIGEETDNTTMSNNSSSTGNDESNSRVSSKMYIPIIRRQEFIQLIMLPQAMMLIHQKILALQQIRQLTLTVLLIHQKILKKIILT